MNPKKFPMPTGMLLKTDDEEKFLPFQNPTTYKDITVELKPNGEALRVYVTADTTPVQRVTLYFADPLPEKAQVLGGVWERGYGDYEWRGYVPHRVMPWYFFLQSDNKTEAFGVHTQPAAMCWLDSRKHRVQRISRRALRRSRRALKRPHPLRCGALPRRIRRRRRLYCHG